MKKVKQLRVKTCARWQRKDWNADDAERTDVKTIMNSEL